MNRLIRRAAVAAFLCGTAATASVVLYPVYAAQQQQQRGPTVSRGVINLLREGQMAFQAMDYATAIAKGLEADAVENKTPYDVYQVSRLLALAYIRQNDLANGLTQMTRAIETNAGPEEEKLSNYNTAMLLAFSAKDYPKAVLYGTERMKLGPLDEQGNLVLIQAYYNAENYPQTEAMAAQVVASAKAAGQRPAVPVLQMLFNAQLRQDKTAAAGETAVELALADPSVVNWSRAIDTFFPTNGTDHQMLNLYRLKRLTKSMNANDYLSSATAALKVGLGQEAKEIYAEGIAAGTITQASAGDAFGQANTIAAREAATLAEFERAAAAAPTGDTDVKLGETLWVYKRAAEGETAIRRGIMKGGIADMADAQMTFGIVLLSQGKKDEAIQAFTQAGASPQYAGVAKVWTLYAQNS